MTGIPMAFAFREEIARDAFVEIGFLLQTTFEQDDTLIDFALYCKNKLIVVLLT